MAKHKIKHLFIDSNIWLSLYQLSPNDLNRFEKIKTLINKDFKLYVPQQVVDEVHRNRENKIKESFPEFKKFDIYFPNYCKPYEEFEDFKKDYNKLKARHSDWVSKIDKDIKSNQLKPDSIIFDIFNMSGVIDSDEYIESAIVRYKKGNPPGKDNKYGDAINWECLLDKVPADSDLYFISDDRDFKSPISENGFNFYLSNEWKEKKNGIVFYYNNLVDFLNDHTKEIQLADELEKKLLIQYLTCSSSFAETHNLINKLKEFREWTDNQIKELCYACITNNQILYILNDADVRDFYSTLVNFSEGDDDSLISKIKSFSDAYI